MANTTLPSINDGLTADVTAVLQPSYTYALDYPNTGQINGFIDGLEAVKQAIYKIINTERYQYVIYSWNYGIELSDLFGKPIPYVYAEIQRRVTEALTWDDRINSVSNFQFSHNGGDILVTFDVATIYGTITVEKGVTGIV